MNLTVKTNDLKEALKLHKKTSSKITNFILTGIKLTADQDRQTLTLENTDLELSIRTVLKADVKDSGQTIVPLKNLDNLANTVKENQISMNLIETKKMVKSSRQVSDGFSLQMIDKEPQIIQAETREDALQKALENHLISQDEINKLSYRLYEITKREEFEEEITDQTLQIYKLKLNTFMVEEFPNFPEFKKEEQIKTSENLNFKDFNTAIGKVIDFVSKDQNRVILTGILLDTKNNKIAAMDSYKLAQADFDFKNSLELPFIPNYEGQEPQKDNIVLPSRVYELLKMFKEENFNIKRTKDQIDFTLNNITIISRLFSGKFPDYERLIPDDNSFNYEFKINADKTVSILDEAVKLLNVDTKNNMIPIKIRHEEENGLKFSIDNKEVGQYESIIDIEVIKTVQEDHEPLQFAVNPEYLKICLKNLTTPMLKIIEPLKPLVIEEEENKDLKIVLMPIRIS
jgi:DNA polymerase-3 subunit beta